MKVGGSIYLFPSTAVYMQYINKGSDIVGFKAANIIVRVTP